MLGTAIILKLFSRILAFVMGGVVAFNCVSKLFLLFCSVRHGEKSFVNGGGELPNGRGSPITARTIGEYLQQMRHKVAQHGFRQMMNIRLSGHVQIDETFVATKRKHNRGRVKRNRKFTLVRH